MLVIARIRLGIVLRLVRATPALPPAVAWFLGRALCVAIVGGDAFSLRSAAEPHQLAMLLGLAAGRRRVVELGTATGWTAAAFALAEPARTVVSCDPHVQPGRGRYLRLLRASTRARIALVHAAGADAAALDEHEVDLLFIDSGHERQGTIDEWNAWRPRLAADALVVFHDYDHPDFPGIAQAIEELGLTGRRQDGMFVWRASASRHPASA
ncbi:MAG TPA: class I SAM-dependent methyltransferase [Baekduia sp.]|jgi:spermidine synthase